MRHPKCATIAGAGLEEENMKRDKKDEKAEDVPQDRNPSPPAEEEGTGSNAGPSLTTEDEEALVKRLRDLGYME